MSWKNKQSYVKDDVTFSFELKCDKGLKSAMDVKLGLRSAYSNNTEITLNP
jgi:hypothetical protein